MHCVDLGESLPTSIYLRNLVSIQPRTSPVKFALSARVNIIIITDPPFGQASLGLPRWRLRPGRGRGLLRRRVPRAGRVPGDRALDKPLGLLGPPGGLRRGSLLSFPLFSVLSIGEKKF